MSSSTPCAALKSERGDWLSAVLPFIAPPQAASEANNPHTKMRYIAPCICSSWKASRLSIVIDRNTGRGRWTHGDRKGRRRGQHRERSLFCGGFLRLDLGGCARFGDSSPARANAQLGQDGRDVVIHGFR